MAKAMEKKDQDAAALQAQLESRIDALDSQRRASVEQVRKRIFCAILC
jgi:hypothetical protein